MKIKENCIVSMRYELRETDAEGAVLEVMDISYPFIFFYKSTLILNSFQENLRGLEAGNPFEFVIPCKIAYGERKDEKIVDIPVEQFGPGNIKGEAMQDVGEYVTVTDSQGYMQNGVVVKKTLSHLTVDLNHSFAGIDMHFKGKILSVRMATNDEMIQKRYIQPSGNR